MPLVDVNGVRLMVEESGDGEPLVLVHGSWEDRHTWAPIEEELASRFRVIAYDRRDHTDSEGGGEGDARRDDEDDLAALIEERGLGSANVVANSFGGSIALGLAARRPELCRRICAHEPPLMALVADDPMVAQSGEAVGAVVELIERGEREAGAREFAEKVALGPGGWAMLPEQARATMIRNAETFAGEALDASGFDMDLDALSRVEAPVLLTQGDQSPPFFARIIARLEEAMDGAEVRTLPGAGHVPHSTHPAEYIAVIDEFVFG
jgi:pimeloyl-ACP methyl ester carboxylesterase